MRGSLSHAHAARSVVPVARMSTVDLIVIELRKAILQGHLAVGGPIGEIEIASQLGVSRGPLREAAQRLVQEGLLVSIPGRGLRVRRIPVAEVPDLYEARYAVEAHAVARLAAEPAVVAVAELEAALARLVAVSTGDEAIVIGDADIAFHRTLVELIDSPRLLRTMETLLAETRIASLSAPDGYHVRRTVSTTYRALIDAIRAGDGEAGCAALRRQFDDAVARITGEDDATETVDAAPSDAPATFSPIEHDAEL
ncbi:GntR family transcriptional regulator [Microbacterium sp. ZXX196]|uniref:GntR family transcriptional regulator n=1 Tax=Microbacterium sp. ZXX196 TaxID=2609291 RepID=UPI0012B8B985|nr:GntR family transcriptional regulator [Microbacterium sp. ZXX196]MTE23321.1 FCD domain-containing protein [Microbacterium sp. ZXX196]